MAVNTLKISSLIIFASVFCLNAQSNEHHRLDSEEVQCIGSLLPEGQDIFDLNELQRESLLESCGVEVARQGKRKRPPHQGELQEEDRQCLEARIGKRNEGPRPSREEMDAAMSACGIEKPSRQEHAMISSEEELNQLISEFQATEDHRQKHHIINDLKESFRQSEDEEFKSKIRSFLVSNIKNQNQPDRSLILRSKSQ